MPFAARITDSTTHGGVITGPGVSSVLIGGLPAVVTGDMHACAIYLHAVNAVVQGSSSVVIGGRPAVRMGDSTACGASIVMGATNVDIGG
jgi:uncharacterized Zn-binding protein involved in type VI secretion